MARHVQRALLPLVAVYKSALRLLWYSRRLSVSMTAAADGDELPDYRTSQSLRFSTIGTETGRSRTVSQSPRGPSEHVYHLTNRHERPWLTLRVESQARSSTSTPLYWKEGTISGSINLSLERTDHIEGISVIVSGSRAHKVC